MTMMLNMTSVITLEIKTMMMLEISMILGMLSKVISKMMMVKK